MRTVLVGIVAADIALAPLTASAAADPSWEQWQTVAGVFAFGRTGAFGPRLLASEGSGGKTVIAAVDCRGTVQPITSSAPALEGGLAVAPLGFGVFGGDLIAPDEVGGSIYAIAPDGKLATILKPSLPTGGDIGVESLGFVPTGLLRGGRGFLPSPQTQGKPHPRTAHL